MKESASAAVRSRLTHPVIDSDGHTIEFEPAMLDHLREIAGPEVMERCRSKAGERLRWSLGGMLA